MLLRQIVIWCSISIHSLRVEGDAFGSVLVYTLSNFNPLPPCGGRRFWFRFGVYSEQFQSTPSVWRETAPVIHVTCQCRDFNPRPPCGGRRHGSQGRDGRLYTFQATPSVWRETNILQLAITHIVFQSTPSVWRETDG